MEARIARIESHVEHMQSDITEIKADVEKLDQKFDFFRESVTDFRLEMERSFTKLKLWGLMLYVALAGSLLGVMAKGFGWIE